MFNRRGIYSMAILMQEGRAFTISAGFTTDMNEMVEKPRLVFSGWD